MQTYANRQVALMTAVLTAGLCLASVLAAVSVGVHARPISAARSPVSAAARSITAVEVNYLAQSAGGANAAADRDIGGSGGAIPTDLGVARVYFQ